MKRNLMKDMPEEYLRKLVKERLKEKREAIDKAERLTKELRSTKNKVWQLSDAISETKEVIGRKKALTCPAFKAMKVKSGYCSDYTECKAKRFKSHYLNDGDMARLHCFFCKLTPVQAKDMTMWDRIFNGKRDER